MRGFDRGKEVRDTEDGLSAESFCKEVMWKEAIGEVEGGKRLKERV